MNIQINANDKVTENEFLYIYHNLKSIIKRYTESYEYQQQKNFVKKYSWQKPPQWKYELSGFGGIGARVGRRLWVTGSNDTLYFKFKELTNEDKKWSMGLKIEKESTGRK